MEGFVSNEISIVSKQYSRSPQPVDHGLLLAHGLFATGLCERLAGVLICVCMHSPTSASIAVVCGPTHASIAGVHGPICTSIAGSIAGVCSPTCDRSIATNIVDSCSPACVSAHDPTHMNNGSLCADVCMHLPPIHKIISSPLLQAANHERLGNSAVQDHFCWHKSESTTHDSQKKKAGRNCLPYQGDRKGDIHSCPHKMVSGVYLHRDTPLLSITPYKSKHCAGFQDIPDGI